tara:strand:- start:160 stop:393 length:234 start_codon:yes stop_codon:yes gene_type:complete
MDKEIKEKVSWLKSKGNGGMTNMMLNEVEYQFIDMANGGMGDCENIRSYYYSDVPDIFFQAVCDKMGWNWRKPEEVR